jgi:diacylglycerol kinase family enzyme
MNPRGPSAAQRAAALGALLAAALALVASAFILVNLGPALLLVLCVAVAVAGAWEVLSRRGAARLVALVVVLAALVGAAAVVLVRGQFHGVMLVVTIVLVALALVLARYSLAWRAPRPEEVAPTGDVVPPARHPVLIMNPKSGGGKVERFHMVEEAQKRGIEAVLLNKGDDLLQLARDAVRRGADVLGMAGGDGSQAAVAAIAAEQGVAFVCVPVGTRMDFARDLGLDIVDPVRSLDAFKESIERRIDLGRVNDQVFVNNVSLGVYGSIVQSTAYRDAKLKTAADMLPDLLAGGALSKLVFTGPDGAEHAGAQIIQVSNNPYQLESLTGFASRVRLDTGTLGLLAAKVDGPREAVDFVALEVARRVRSFRGWMQWQAPDFEVRSDGPIDIAIDGEAVTVPSPIRFAAMPGALRIRIPRDALGLSAAAVAELTPGWSIGELVDTLRGGRGQSV